MYRGVCIGTDKKYKGGKGMVERKIDVDVIEIVKKYIDEISKKFDIQEVYLFGSYAKGTNNKDSDIDIAVVLKSDTNSFDIMVDLMMLTQNIDLRIEPHPIKIEDFENGNPFVDEIKNTGLKVA